MGDGRNAHAPLVAQGPRRVRAPQRAAAAPARPSGKTPARRVSAGAPLTQLKRPTTMKDLQHKRLEGYRLIEDLLKTTAETSHLAILPAKLTQFSALLAELNALAQVQLRPTHGQTAERRQRFAAALEAALVVSGLVRSFAADRRDHELAARAQLMPSDFARRRLVLRLMLPQRVHDAAVPHLAELASYGLTSAMLADLQAKIDAAAATFSTPDLARNERTVATARMAEIFFALDALIETHLDALLRPLREMSRDFYFHYRAYRPAIRPSRGLRRHLPISHATAAPNVAALTLPPPAEERRVA